MQVRKDSVVVHLSDLERPPNLPRPSSQASQTSTTPASKAA